MRGLVSLEMIKQSNVLMEKKADWFADYNGKKLQRTEKATYYRADEDMWLIPYLDIYTKYEGSSYLSWESYVKNEGHLMKNGCMPKIREGDGVWGY